MLYIITGPAGVGKSTISKKNCRIQKEVCFNRGG